MSRLDAQLQAVAKSCKPPSRIVGLVTAKGRPRSFGEVENSPTSTGTPEPPLPQATASKISLLYHPHRKRRQNQGPKKA